MPKPLYRVLAERLIAANHCTTTGNTKWLDILTQVIRNLCAKHLPHGSGLDGPVGLLQHDSKPDRLVFTSDFHHMDEHGGYDGWTEHRVIVTPSLAYGFDLRVTGRDRNSIKDYLHDVWNHALAQGVE